MPGCIPFASLEVLTDQQGSRRQLAELRSTRRCTKAGRSTRANFAGNLVRCLQIVASFDPTL